MTFVYEIIALILTNSIWGGLLHLFDVPIRFLSNQKIRMLSRYGVGVTGALPPFLMTFDRILSAADILSETDQRRGILYIITATYLLTFVPVGLGVIAAYFLEQLLDQGLRK